MENNKLQEADLGKKAENEKAKPFKLLAKHKKAIRAIGTTTTITAACKLARIERKTFYHWYNTIPEFAEQIDLAREAQVDEYELELKRLSQGQYYIMKDEKGNDVKDQNGDPVRVYYNEPNPTATIFALKTLGKKRGYTQRIEVTGADGNAIGVTEIRVRKPVRPERKK
jgi:hypothetical protein